MPYPGAPRRYRDRRTGEIVLVSRDGDRFRVTHEVTVSEHRSATEFEELDQWTFRTRYDRESYGEIALVEPSRASSQIKLVGYDPATLDLVLVFRGGAAYRYWNVEHVHASALMGTGGGAYFARTIKADAARYPYERLGNVDLGEQYPSAPEPEPEPVQPALDLDGES